MTSPRQDLGARFLLVAASFVVLIAGLRAAATLILPFLIAVFIAMISLPLQNWLQARGVPGWLAVLATLMSVILVAVVVGLLLGGSVKAFTDKAPTYQALLQTKAAEIVQWLRGRGVEIPANTTTDLINPGVALDLVTRTLRGVAAVLSNLLLVLLTIVFILSEAAGFPLKLEFAFGERTGSAQRFEKIKREVQSYLGIKTLVSLFTGAVIGLAMWMLGVDFPVLWGLLAFLLNYIPSLGSILAAVPPVLLAIVQFGFGRALAVALVFVVVNVALGNLVEPQLMGRRLGLSTLVVFLSLVFWGWVWGPVGMLLSVPLTMVIKIMLENTEDLRWIAVLLDANPRQERA